EYVGVVGTVDRSEIHRFTFPPQEHRIAAGKSAKEPAREEGRKDKGREVWAVDDVEHCIELKAGKRTALEREAVQVLLRNEIVRAPDQRAQLRKTAGKLLEGEDALAAWSPASLALLTGEAPTFGQAPSARLPCLAPGGPLLERARE